MAMIKPLNPVNGEQHNANRTLKNNALDENDGQAFAQTLRQQMQQETQAKLEKDAENRKADENRLATQSRVSEQQETDSRLASKMNQVKSKETESNKADDDNAKPAVNEKARLRLSSQLNRTQVELETSKAAEAALKKDTQAQDSKQITTDENVIANMGWLASMMAMRDNQGLPNTPSINTDTDKTLASATLRADKLGNSELTQADDVLPKTTLYSEHPTDEQDATLESLSGLQKDNITPYPLTTSQVTTNAYTDSKRGLDIRSAQGDESVVKSSEFAENELSHQVDNGLSLVGDPQTANFSKTDLSRELKQAGDQFENHFTDNLQNTLNSQATVTSHTEHRPEQALQAMVSQINVPFGIKGWQEAMNTQVMRMTQQGNELATLTLSPPDLGPVQVVLRVDNQSVDAAFVSDNANVRQALQDGLQDLKERMASQGLQLGNTFVGNDNQAQQHFGNQNRPAPEALTQLNAPANPELTSTSVRNKPLGLVDTFV